MLHVFPQVIHTYKNWLMDSARWDAFTPRDDDIVIATPYKSGTTWMQLIVGSLVFRDRSVHDVFAEVDSPYRITPWLDMKHNPIEEVIADLEGQTHRRFIKTHLPLDG
ncbi:MAG: sulfotransferase domain-containing protein, partial [Candidatus Poribacteria bacterium]|nr:sulfotransferase domain-containing protein [Candidatus Poribacteria bacterium]